MNVHGEVLLVLMNMFIFVKNQNHHFYFQEHSPKIVEAEIVYTRSLEVMILPRNETDSLNSIDVASECDGKSSQNVHDSVYGHLKPWKSHQNTNF